MAVTTTLNPTAWADTMYEGGYEWRTDDVSAGREMSSSRTGLYYKFELPSEKSITGATANFQCVVSQSINVNCSLSVQFSYDSKTISVTRNMDPNVSVPFTIIAFDGKTLVVSFLLTNYSYGRFTIQSPTLTVTYENIPTLRSITPTNNQEFAYDGTVTFSWSVSNGTQASAEIYYRTSSSGSYSKLDTISGSGNNYPCSASRFANRSVSWYVVVETADGRKLTSEIKSFSVQSPPLPPPDPPIVVPPTVESVSISPINTGLDADFANTAIAGISRCRVQASVSKGTNNISRVYFTYPEGSGSITMTLSGGVYVGETTLALSQSNTFTVTAVDTEGNSKSKTASITVEPYAEPTIRIYSLIRSDENGIWDTGGEYFTVNASASCSSVDGKNYIDPNDPGSFTARVKGSSHYVQLSNSTIITSDTPELVDEDSVYVIVVSATDHIGRTSSVEVALAGRLRDVVFKRDTTHTTVHVGIGMSPAGGDQTSIQLPPGGKIIIGGQDITDWLRNQIGGSW